MEALFLGRAAWRLTCIFVGNQSHAYSGQPKASLAKKKPEKTHLNGHGSGARESSCESSLARLLKNLRGGELRARGRRSDGHDDLWKFVDTLSVWKFVLCCSAVGGVARLHVEACVTWSQV